MPHRKAPTDVNEESEVAQWRRRLQVEGSTLQAEDQAALQQCLDHLKSNPPLDAEATCYGETAEPIRFPGPPTASAPLGQLGDYDILDELGRGTFGAVYKALDRRLQREVAIKVLNPQHAAVQSERQRFEREARAVSRLGHDHIVRVYNVCTESEFPLPYLVMELIDGRSLADQQAWRRNDGQGPLVPRRTAGIIRQVALALAAAHDRGLVHRDIKPSNILLERSTGRAKVTDFGLARELAAPSQWSTASSRIIGTLPYMSPEQVLKPDRVGAQSDLYSLGVVLYELLTGERPFRGTGPALLVQVAHDDPQTPRKLNPAVPRDLETICLKCLEKEPARRYASAAALAEELQRFSSGEPIHARPVSLGERVAKWAKRQRTVAALLAAVVLIMVLGLSGVFWQWGRAEAGREAAKQAQARAEHARDGERDLRTELEKQLYFQRVALAHHEWLSNRQARADQLLEQCSEEHRGWEWRCLQRMIHRETQTLRGHALEVRRVTFSPDGKLVASVGGLWNRRDPGSVIVWDAQSGERLRRFTADSGGFYGVAVSPDSQRVAAANSAEGVVVWSLVTGRKEFTASGWHYDVAFSPTGQLLAGAGGDGTVRTWHVDTWQLHHELTGLVGEAFSVTFSPDGKWLASTGRRRTARVWDVQSGEPVQVLAGAGNRCVAFTPDGRFLASCGYGSQDMGLVKVWEVDQWKEIVDERVPTGPVQWLCVSPDGRLLALPDARHGSVRVWETTTGRERRIVRAPSSLGVAFSPDGRTLATSGSDRTVKLWDMTRRDPVIVRPDAAYVSCLAFNPDSTRLAIDGGQNTASGRGTKTVQIWDVTSPDDCRLERVLAGHQDWLTSVAYSADGKRLASADRAGAIKIWDTSNSEQLRTMQAGEGAVLSVAFSPDGQRLAAGSREEVVRLWDIGTGEPLRTLEGHQGRVNQVAFSPNARWIASASEDKTARLWDATTGRALHTLVGHDSEIMGVVFDSRGELLATCGRDGLVKLWAMTADEGPAAGDSQRQSLVVPSLVRTLRGHTAAVNAVSFSSDSARLASISDDESVILWDVAAGNEALTLTPNGRALPSAVCFSPNGNLLAAARRHRVTLWDASDGTPRHAALRAPEGRRRALAWHQEESAACENEKSWFAAVHHRRQLIALEPHEPMHHFQRGNAYMEWHESHEGNADQLERALADFEQAVQLSGGLFLSGRGDHVAAPHIPFDQYQGFTIEAWVYNGYRGSIMVQGRSGDPENSIWLSPGRSFGTLGSDTCGWESGKGDNYYDSIDQPLPRHWSHLSLVYDGDRLRLFLNGKLMKQKPAPKPGPLEPSRALLIGGNQYQNTMLFSSGLLRSIRISSAPIYASDFTPSDHLQADSDTVLLYDFGRNRDWMSDATVADLSGNGNDGTLQGAWIEKLQGAE